MRYNYVLITLPKNDNNKLIIPSVDKDGEYQELSHVFHGNEK